jgi:hypothetical protein
VFLAEMANRAVVRGVNETLALAEIWKEEDVEAQLEGIHRNMAVYNKLAVLVNLRGYNRTAARTVPI